LSHCENSVCNCGFILISDNNCFEVESRYWLKKMVSTVTPYTDPRNRAYAGEGFDGVVRVTAGGFYGTGVLLFDGRAVLTVAHLFTSASASTTKVFFETTAGSQTVAVSRVSVLPSYNAINENNDLALVWLADNAPIQANRYQLYRESDELGQVTTLVGYGVPGTGSLGVLDSFSGSPMRLLASNQFEADGATLKRVLGAAMGWSPLPGSQLIADFDSGTGARDALGQLINIPGLGLGTSEGIISSGDSGGPAFIGNKVAGIASYGASLESNVASPDIDSEVNSSFGEIGAWQRVSFYQQWIDQTLRAQHPQAPSRAADVQKVVPEGNSGTSYAYFLLQFTGVRNDAASLLSVDYATRDGSAKAGFDYLAVRGTLVLYPNENHVAIPVEVVGDRVAEPDEFFYLDVTNPVGGSFGMGVVMLTAVRTIANDDGVF
jgi:secreted trypsin-like serine protease